MKNITTLVLALFIVIANAQEHRSAIAFPASNINIDGDLSDWPSDIEKNKIENLGFGEVEDIQDLSADFMVSYDESMGNLFVAIQIEDSENIDRNPTDDINLVDRILLYIDPVHKYDFGSSIIFETSEHYKEIATKPIAWNPFLKDINWDNIDVAIQRVGNITTYEWSLDLGSAIKENAVLGFDLIVADVDSVGDESWMLWKPGTGKSETASRLGEIILAKSKNEIGSIEGNMGLKKQWQNVFQLAITSTVRDNLWIRTSVDSNGHFAATLPFSSYTITPFSEFSSPMFSGGFNQKTRKLGFVDEVNIDHYDQLSILASSIEVVEKPIPTGFLAEKGILFNDVVDEAEVDEFIQAYQSYFQIPGISVALIKDKKVIYSKAFGVKNNITQEPLQKSSLFEAASITKSVFSLIVLKMAERGEIDLDKPIYTYLPLPNLENDPYYKLITARHILNHRSGLDNWPLGSYTGQIPDYEISLLFKPGEKFLYSGEAMNYLGRVVEKIKGKAIDEIFNEEIKPAFNLENTSFHYSEDLEAEMALGHYQNLSNHKYKYNDVNSPASSMVTEASDFASFVTGLMDKKYLSTDSYELIYNIHKEMEDEQKLYDKESKQGLAHGFFVTETPTGKIVAHGGNNGDYDCLFAMIPEEEKGFVVFTNSNLGDEFNRLLSIFLLHGKAYLIDF